MVQDTIVADLRRLIGTDAVVTDMAARIAAGTDFITRRGVPGAVARPSSPDQVAALVGFASERGVELIPRGAGTNLCGGIFPRGESVVMDLSGMDHILEIDTEGRRAVVEPGVINGDLKARVAPAGLVYSPDPASSPISTIGGNIAENAGGPGCIKYGVTFHHVLALDVALTDGRLVTLRDDDDVDLLGLMIGSEGMLGVVTRAVLNLRPLPAARWTAMAAFDSVEGAAVTVSEIIAAGILPAALEICDRRQIELCEAYLPSGYPLGREAILFVELDGDSDEVARDAPDLERLLRDRDPALRTATDELDRTRLWAGRLAAMHAYKKTGKEVYVCDVTVPRQRLPEMIARARQIAAERGLDVATVGHAGDGNVHPVILYQPQELEIVAEGASQIAAAALDLGGTLTGEHGIGTAKLAQMHRRFSPVELAAFRAIKHAFDPACVLNPSVMLPPPEPEEPDLEALRDLVVAALSGGVIEAPASKPGMSDAVSIDAENMTLSAGGEALCRDAAAAVTSAGLSCPTMEADGIVRDVIEGAGHRQPARAALLGVEAVLPGGHNAMFGSAAMKDVAGLDVKRLIAGGRGAFGRVNRVTLRAMPHRT